MNFLTYPARPVDGGNKPTVPPIGDWSCSPKLNGWRTLINTKTGEMWNRKGNRLSIQREFVDALGLLQLASPFEWLDCEGLERRHNIGSGSLIILDAVIPDVPFEERKAVIDSIFPQLEIDNYLRCERNSVYSVPEWEGDAIEKWNTLIDVNKQLKCEYTEGLVMKSKTSRYPIQKISAEKKCWEWIKFRFV
jgi:ATP-dependent DNA ligase|tara:strand:- start:12179 stop:12754 length:576 start_codon:yes stop_codon:yes gene_type:complete